MAPEKALKREIEELKKKLLDLGSLVADITSKAVESIEKRDPVLAREVMEHDDEIDRMEVELEEECLKLLALHRPVGNDLRFIIAMLKINNDLERVGDLAANIAERSLSIAGQKALPVPAGIKRMGDLARLMLQQCLEAQINLDETLANRVRQLDDEVDDLHREMFTHMKVEIQNTPDQIDILIQYGSVSRYLERIADLATNIAEDIIYMVVGDIVRHKD
jgi:phosphate transport system protein